MELCEFYKKQKELDTMILQKRFGRPNSKLHDIAHSMVLNERIIALFVEIGELCNEAESWKYWKEHKRNDREKQLKEYVDVMHFFLSIGNTLGFEPHEIENAYSEVYEDNILRQERNY